MALNYDLINQDFAVPEGYRRNQDGDYMGQNGLLWDPYDQYQQSLNTASSFGIPPEELARWQSLADFQGMTLDQYIRSAQGDYTTSQDKYGSTIYSPTSGTVNQAGWPYHNAPDGTENGWMLPLAIAGGGLLAQSGLFGGATGAASSVGGALPESYWSMLAEAGGAGVPSAAAGTVGTAAGAGLSAADIAGLTQMGQAAGLSGGALDAFVASGGMMGSTAGGGSLASSLMNLFTPTPTSLATQAAGQVLQGSGGTSTNTNSLWGNLLTAFGPSLLSMIGSGLQSSAANDAAGAQTAAAQLGIDEQRRQFDAARALLQPYVSAGTGALSGQQNLLGLNGAPAQQGAYDMLQNSPAFTSLTQTGENAILQNASATGGLRGGNTQAALAQFRPALLAQLVQSQFQNLGGLTQIGANAAAGTGTAGMNTGNNVTQLLAQQGASQAGAALAGGKAQSNMLGALGGGLGMFAGLGGFQGI